MEIDDREIDERESLLVRSVAIHEIMPFGRSDLEAHVW